MRLSGLTIGIVSRTKEEARDLLKGTLRDEYIVKNEIRGDLSIDIYRSNVMRVVWIEEQKYLRRGNRFNTVYCDDVVRKTVWFREAVQPYIMNYSYIYRDLKIGERI